MPTTYADRLQGLTTSVAVKPPCRVATTAPILAAGLQTIDGVPVSPGDRVLRKDETDASLNGIWNAAAGAWARALDFNGSRDAVGGTQTMVLEGTTNGNTYWRVSGEGPVTIGTDDITFERALLSDSSVASFIQSGAGAVEGDVQTELRFTVRPEQFGGATDADRINAAIDYVAGLAAGGVVECDAKTYSIDSVVLLKANVTLRGKGKAKTIFQQSGTMAAWAAITTSTGIVSTLSANSYQNVHVIGIRVVGLYSSPIPSSGPAPYAKNGISLGNVAYSSVEDCRTEDTGTGIIMYGTVAGVVQYRNRIIDCETYNARSWNAAGNTGAPRGITMATPYSDVIGCLADNCYTGHYLASEHGTLLNCHSRKSTDDGYYINANYGAVIACKAEGGDTRAGASGSGFAINPAHGVRLVGCDAIRYPNSGIRMRHDAAIAPYEITIDTCHIEDCGYGILTDTTGALAWPTGIAAQNIKITNNTIKACQFSGIKLLRFNGGVISGNEVLGNNLAGVSIQTRGGISLDEYVTNCWVDNNVTDDQWSGTQVFGLYSYLASTSGAISENTGNYFNHRTLFGTDLYYARVQSGTVNVSITTGNRSGDASISFAQRFEGVPVVTATVMNRDALASGERPGVPGFEAALTATGGNVWVDLFANAAADRVVKVGWIARYDA